MTKAFALVLFAMLSLALFFGCTQNGQQPTINQGTPQQQPASPSNGIQTGGDNLANSNANVAKKGDTVQVDYIGKLPEGKVFDTSIQQVAIDAGIPQRDRYEPLEFTVGAGQMIAGFDAAVVGMKEGEEKTVTLPPEQAYGMPKKDMILPIDISALGENVKVGDRFYSSNGVGGTVTKIEGGKAYLDFNHELAGKTLVFYIKLIKVK
ncbi:MAG: peptidylprolyl isomerase [Candidatus Anstonellaceae archaeon]